MIGIADDEPFDTEVISQDEWESHSSRLHRRVLGLRGAAVVLTVITGFLVARFIGYPDLSVFQVPESDGVKHT